MSLIKPGVNKVFLQQISKCLPSLSPVSFVSSQKQKNTRSFNLKFSFFIHWWSLRNMMCQENLRLCLGETRCLNLWTLNTQQSQHDTVSSKCLRRMEMKLQYFTWRVLETSPRTWIRQDLQSSQRTYRRIFNPGWVGDESSFWPRLWRKQSWTCSKSQTNTLCSRNRAALSLMHPLSAHFVRLCGLFMNSTNLIFLFFPCKSLCKAFCVW